ncbi:MAG: LysM peptidoglycan-binding domain-containing protein [Chloroflexi bacterium]|nr:MAG: LysM peptidoglycan-binding domain-containing protein [Chloroflexota bacterium]
MKRIQLPSLFLLPLLLLTSCLTPEQTPPAPVSPINQPDQAAQPFPTPEAEFTPLPTRPPYQPGELVDYIAQTGDTLPALAAHFNTTETEIRAANPIIPQDATTMPPGLPMKIPIYYMPLWGSFYQIIPDSLFVDGPAQVGFDVKAFVESQPGWLKTYSEQIADGPHSGAELVQIVSKNFSISPRLLLALLEYYAGALSRPDVPQNPYALNYSDPLHKGLYLQMVWAANTLNNGYYSWRRGTLTEFEHPDGRLERPDPWQNAASVALRYLFSRQYSSPVYDQVVGPGGLAQAYAGLFGDPWINAAPHIPGSLRQPQFLLPFERDKTWNYTGGPHTGWGKGEPFAAIDFAPTGVAECGSTAEWTTAMADGVVVRSETDGLALDLDGDGQEETGWVIFYLHLAATDRAPLGKTLKAGERIGHPSCEGGETTGTHVHLARKYNGEWILADSPLPFDMEGWLVRNGTAAYKGMLTRFSQTVIASSKSESKSVIKSGE